MLLLHNDRLLLQHFQPMLGIPDKLFQSSFRTGVFSVAQNRAQSDDPLPQPYFLGFQLHRALPFTIQAPGPRLLLNTNPQVVCGFFVLL